MFSPCSAGGMGRPGAAPGAERGLQGRRDLRGRLAGMEAHLEDKREGETMSGVGDERRIKGRRRPLVSVTGLYTLFIQHPPAAKQTFGP